MTEMTREALRQQRCEPCEGGVPPVKADEARQQMQAIPEWKLAPDAKSLSRKLDCKSFKKAVERLNEIAELAEQEQHHPDLHLTGYRNLRVELTTHAIGGLSRNDFIIAAKIDDLLS